MLIPSYLISVPQAQPHIHPQYNAAPQTRAQIENGGSSTEILHLNLQYATRFGCQAGVRMRLSVWVFIESGSQKPTTAPLLINTVCAGAYFY